MRLKTDKCERKEMSSQMMVVFNLDWTSQNNMEAGLHTRFKGKSGDDGGCVAHDSGICWFKGQVAICQTVNLCTRVHFECTIHTMGFDVDMQLTADNCCRNDGRIPHLLFFICVSCAVLFSHPSLSDATSCSITDEVQKQHERDLTARKQILESAICGEGHVKS